MPVIVRLASTPKMKSEQAKIQVEEERDQWTSQRTRGYRCKRSVLDAFYTTDLDFGRRNRRQLVEGEVKEEGEE